MMSRTTDPTGPSTGSGPAPPLVTIWEEYGSGADSIGRAVADRLKLPYHQQAFSSEDLAGEEAPQDDNPSLTIANRISLAQVFSAMGGAYGGDRGDGTEFLAAQQERRALVEENNATVHGYGREGGVIVGRNATMILANRPSTLHVLLTADPESRVAHAAQSAGISTAQAEKRLRHEDKVRTDMSSELYGWDPRKPENYDLMINTGRIPHKAAVEAIVHAVQRATA